MAQQLHSIQDQQHIILSTGFYLTALKPHSINKACENSNSKVKNAFMVQLIHLFKYHLRIHMINIVILNRFETIFSQDSKILLRKKYFKIYCESCQLRLSSHCNKFKGHLNVTFIIKFYSILLVKKTLQINICAKSQNQPNLKKGCSLLCKCRFLQ